MVLGAAVVRHHLRGLASVLLYALTLLAVAAAHAGQLIVHVSDAAGRPVPDSVVMVRDLGASRQPEATPMARMVQHSQSFNPTVLAVAVGTSVEFPNEDRMRHHIYSFSPTRRFEVRLYAGSETPSVRFDQPGIVTLGCNIHDWMLGFIFVADSPYFAVADANGVASIGEVPDGTYELVLWHPTLAESPIVKPERLKISGPRELATLLPGEAVAVNQAPAETDPLAAKFRRRAP